jgi:sugar lactone lactonase YvrE
MLRSSRRRPRLFLVALILAAPAVQSQTIETFAGAPNYVGAPAQQLPLNPRGVAMGPDGHVYVSDYAGNRVLRYDASAGTVTVVAGTGRFGFSGDGGLATDANLRGPRGLAFDAAGNLFIADSDNNRVRRVDAATSVITTVAGSGTWGSGGDGADALAASFEWISGIALNAAGDLFISDEFAQRIRMVSAATGIITTIAGNGIDGDGEDGIPAVSTNLSWPEGIVVDAAGNLYVADKNNHRVRKIAADTGIVTAVAGSIGIGSGPDGVPATETTLTSPTGVALDGAGNLYITDDGTASVRVVAADTGLINTVFGGGSSNSDGPALSVRLNTPEAVAVDAAGVVYVAEWDGNRLRQFAPDTQLVTTLVGNGTALFCGDGQPAVGACLASPRSLAVDTNGNIFVSDYDNQRIRRIDAQTGIIATVAGGSAAPGEGDPQGPFVPNYPRGIALDVAGNLYIAEGSYNRVHKVDAVTGVVSTVAGSGVATYCGDGGPAASACLNEPQAVALDALGNLYIADYGNHRVRKIDALSHVITTVAGYGNATGGLNDGVPATLATLPHPSAVTVDYAGNLFIVDSDYIRIRKVDAQSHLISTVNQYPNTLGLTADALGNIYFTDGTRNLVRRIDAGSGAITTVAGSGVAGFSGDGGPATSASLHQPMGVVADASGNVYIADTSNNRIRRVVAPPQPPAPQISITAPVDGGTYGLYADVVAQYECSDSQSNVASCVGSSPSGTKIGTSVRGSRIFSVSATNAAGGRAVLAHNYSIASQLNFQGFLAPIAAIPAINVVPRSRTIPIKWRLPDGNGGYVSNPASFQSLSQTFITCPSGPINTITETAGGSGLRYDAPTSSFIYSWTTGAQSSCRNVHITLSDGTTHDLLFKVQ